ncbi:hypothetical protein HPB49_020742 [Dermacentor silvarum]|uniref:Uncharacterized protein n=1 Tax=Dermacentor silvarum TaxID=543639 RepID=A0ACB8CHC1_DERSI|nr:hypothetical protein HPB49_020742 [Dermacentor silvarum]
MVTYIAFHWNILRCLSFSVDLIRAERSKPEESRTQWPPYWKTLAYVIYMPTVYLGPLQNYDDYAAQVDKARPPCTPREVGAAFLGVLRSGAHFLLMEVMTHYLYSSAMSEWPWMIGKLDPTSLVGFGLALLFFFYVRYVFTYGFAGALARAEGIQIPPHAKCIARLNRCSQFWRYFDRGMHLFIRRYFYEPVAGSRKGAGWLLLGAAASFAFTWFWHDMTKADGIWCALSVLGIAVEVLVAEARKSAFAKTLEGRYLATPDRMREARALLGSPHYLLTICACMFHLAELDVVLILCRRVLLGKPAKLNPSLGGGLPCWKWNVVKLLHWAVGLTGFAYVIWSFATDDTNRLLPQQMRGAFRPSPYGLQRRQISAHVPAVLVTIIERMMPKPDSGYVLHYLAMARDFRERLLSTLGEDGVLICPAALGPAPFHNEHAMRPGHVSLTAPANVAGMPSTAVPTGMTSDGRPVGVQVVAAPYMDRLCLAVAAELEKAFGGWQAPFELACRNAKL